MLLQCVKNTLRAYIRRSAFSGLNCISEKIIVILHQFVVTEGADASSILFDDRFCNDHTANYFRYYHPGPRRH